MLMLDENLLEYKILVKLQERPSDSVDVTFTDLAVSEDAYQTAIRNLVNADLVVGGFYVDAKMFSLIGVRITDLGSQQII